MEIISRAAIKSGDGEIHTGNSHSDIRITAMKHNVFLDPDDKQSEGFITDTLRFVSREEAAEIAFAVGQVKEKVQKLCSYHLIPNL